MLVGSSMNWHRMSVFDDISAKLMLDKFLSKRFSYCFNNLPLVSEYASQDINMCGISSFMFLWTGHNLQ